MVAFHHVNLSVPEGGVDAEASFLIDVLGYRRIAAGPELERFHPNWFEAHDGSQVHVGVDPDHRPAARAHVAVAFGPGLADVEHHLKEKGIDYNSSQTPGFPSTIFCQDPAGNRWELRGDHGSTEKVESPKRSM
jgi:catechol 2,3-dioxygenase-like lactoylglutathione lyase family enzyme